MIMNNRNIDRNRASATSKHVFFTVDGKVVPWARAGRRGGFSYTPGHVRKYQDWVKVCASQAMEGREPLLGAVCLTVYFVLPIASSWPAWKQEAALQGLVAPTNRPDLDNMVKAIEDACNLVVWKDDAQVVEMQVNKRFGLKPCADVHVEPLDTITSAVEWKEHLRRQAFVPETAGDLFGTAA